MAEPEKPSAYLQRKSRSSYEEGFEDGRQDGHDKGVRIGLESFAAYIRHWGFELPEDIIEGATKFALKCGEDNKPL